MEKLLQSVAIRMWKKMECPCDSALNCNNVGEIYSKLGKHSLSLLPMLFFGARHKIN